MYPKTLKRNEHGNLELGGCDLVQLAKRHSTPLYVIDEKTIRGVLQEYKSAFSNYKNTRLLYASKACLNMGIAKIVSDEGFGFDTVSGGEIYTVYKAGCDMSKVLFNGNNKSPEEIELALNLGVGRISVDNFHELDLLNKIAQKPVDILLRITPGIECHTHDYIKTGQLESKFGFDMEQIDTAINLILNKYKNLNLKGLHAHIGSQIFEIKVFEDELYILLNEIERIKTKFNIELTEINMGGGIGVKYTEQDEPVSIFDVAQKVISKLKDKNLTLYLEPGRSIISTAGVTLYEIGSSKTVEFNAHKYISIDGGMADNPRPSLYGAKYLAEIANKTENRTVEDVTISGKFCESGDILIEKISLPSPQAGDILCVFNTGAYNYSMASNYNRMKKPEMVLVNNSQSDIIVKRETYDDLISLDVIPKRMDK
ncbi:diaminopimelate decarboxylase [bacterium]|nr:diaminopimelate decarboxylase [bacterium]MBR1754888.1 diaminopimelate decarboxylase [bacterium]